MSAEWRTARLGDVCAYLSRGISPRYVELGGVCVVNQKCVRDHRLSYAHARRHDDSVKRVDASRLVQVGDVLVNSTGTGTLGRVAQIREVPAEPTTVDSHVTIVRPRPDRFHLPFFGYMMVAIEDLIKQAGEGCGGQTELARSTLANDFLVRFPVATTEQQRLAELLDEAFEGIATARANAERGLQNARALFVSHRDGLLTQSRPGWIEHPLSELCEIKHGFAFEGEHFSSEGTHVLLTPGNFEETGGYRDRGPKQKYYVGPIPRGYVLSRGDLLVAMTEQAAGLLGSPALIPESSKFLHNQRLGLVIGRPHMPWNNEFFYHVFNTRGLRDAVHRTASGVKVRHTSPSKIGSVVVRYPPSVTEQIELAQRLNSIRQETTALEALYSRKLAGLDELKRSLLHHAFTGQLTERTAAALGA